MDDLFPMAGRSIKFTSGATDKYNCIAWALHLDQRVVWPDEDQQMAWPPNIAREETVEAFSQFLLLVGFEQISNCAFEPGYEKVALYVHDGLVQHAARSCPDGSWTSKLGSGVDISHPTPETIAAGLYGWPVRYFRRPGFAPPILPDLHPLPAPTPLILLPY